MHRERNSHMSNPTKNTSKEGIGLKIDHNVYILGAGFSRGAGLPLITDFLVRMRDSYEWLVWHGRQREAEAVENVLKFRLEAASAAYWVNLDLENIEELFSLASATKGEMDHHIRIAIAATIDFARQSKTHSRRPLIFQGKSALFGQAGASIQNVKTLPPWVQFTPDVGGVTIHPYTYYVARLLGMLRNGRPKGENTFITFNYDTVLEDALKELGLCVTHGFASESTAGTSSEPSQARAKEIQVLKLHGSVTWARAPRRGTPRTPLVIHETYEELLAKGDEPALVPPTWKKVFGGHLEPVWEAAIERLSMATRIVIIGFSIPPTDMHFKYLMAAGLQKNLSLRQILFVNPTSQAELEPRVRNLLRETYIDSNHIDFEVATLDGFTRASPGSQTKFYTIERPGEDTVAVTI